LISKYINLKNRKLLIINLNTESHVDYSIHNPSIFCEKNIFGTPTLLNIDKKNKLKKYIQISTVEVYGSSSFDDPPFNRQTFL